MTGLSAVSNQTSLFDQNLRGGTQAKAAAAAANPADTTSTSSSDSATIGANDFLTLLVTEMKNQDPTANTDPNEYINQLVQVNSLEQLISINQNLSTALGTTTPTGDSKPASQTTAAASSLTGKTASGANATDEAETPGARAQATALTAPAGARLAPGNLSVPETTPAALRVGHALAGHSKLIGNPPAK